MRKSIILILLTLLIIGTTHAECTLEKIQYETKTSGKTTHIIFTNDKMYIITTLKDMKPDCPQKTINNITLNLKLISTLTGTENTIKITVPKTWIKGEQNPTDPSKTDLIIQIPPFKDETGTHKLNEFMLATLSYIEDASINYHFIDGVNITTNTWINKTMIELARKSTLNSDYTLLTQRDQPIVKVTIPIYNKNEIDEIVGAVVVYNTQQGSDVLSIRKDYSTTKNIITTNNTTYVIINIPVRKTIKSVKNIYIIFATAGVYDITNKPTQKRLIDLFHNNLNIGLALLILATILIKIMKRK